ncbi:MAG: RluA family pseudouridine synthase [Chloroflexi bacterium]|nr:RluA family pseudouridine synthase [Chloroflexota bacterium]
MRTLELVADRSGERVDTFIARRQPELSRSRIRHLVNEGLVTIDGKQVKPSVKVNNGALVTVNVPPPVEIELEPEEIPLNIIYQDENVIVVDKPAGLTVHPAPGHPRGTLVNALLAICPDLRGIGGTLRPGIVHRLDKDTSGLIVVAKNDRASRALQTQLKEREVKKTYVALVRGVPEPAEGMIDAPIGRNPRNRKKMAVVANGRDSQTKYRVVEVLAEGEYALIEAQPITGRTHQIRVHMAAIKHPIVGDSTYGKRSDLVDRQFLHASKLDFAMPVSQRRIEFESPLPIDLRQALLRLGSVSES